MSNRRNVNQQAFAAALDAVLADIRQELIGKNTAYGNSVLNPVRVFSKADNTEQIRVRVDDKLSRIARGKAVGEDVARDLLGYLVILKMAQHLDAEDFKRRAI